MTTTASDTTDFPLVILPEIITGYQYGVGNVFIGPYHFSKNLDQETLHLPPNTTLIEPPAIPDGKLAVWDSSGWILQAIPMSVPVLIAHVSDLSGIKFSDVVGTSASASSARGA